MAPVVGNFRPDAMVPMSTDSPADPRPITEARLLAMVNASGDSFWESDAERRFVHISDNMCRMMGYLLSLIHI